MKALIVFLLWLLLGYGYYQAKTAHCGSAQSATVLPSKTKQKTKRSVAVLPNRTKNSASTSRAAAPTKQTPQDSSYDHSSFNTFKTEGDRTVIPSKDKDMMDDEMQALLEQTCESHSNSMGKVMITAYGKNQASTMNKMENFLIRCGLSPQRVNVRQTKSTDKYSDKLVLQITQ